MSALASLPSLESVVLRYLNYEKAGEYRGLTNLLKMPSLKVIEFTGIHFTSGRGRALLAAFEEGSFVAQLRFIGCSLGLGGDGNDQTGTILALFASSAKSLVCEISLPY